MESPRMEYLVRYGKTGGFGRFRSQKPLELSRGDLVIIESHRGREIGEVISPSTTNIATFLPNSTVGKIFDLLSPDDHRPHEIQLKATQLINAANEYCIASGMDVSVMDAEVLLDEKHAVIHLATNPATKDLGELISSLSDNFKLHIYVENLSQNQTIKEDSSNNCGETCGSTNCNSKPGGCGSCESGGCGTCGAKKEKRPASKDSNLQRRPLL